jgi:hypothetical protein
MGVVQADLAEHGKAACPDCGAAALGRYCVDCGQEIHVHRSLFHLVHELLHGVMHFDGRIWRTLPLLCINPGRLTREWIMGRRSRYVSPLALFLCTLFVIFMGLSFAPPPTNVEMNLPDQIALEAGRLAEAEARLEAAKKATVTGPQTPAASAPASSASAVAPKAEPVESVAEVEALVAARRARLAELRIEARDGRKDGLEPGSWQAQVADLKLQDSAQPNSLGYVVSKKLKNPDLALYKLQQTTYKFAFLLVPLSIPFMALIFLWPRRFTLYDHGVFVLYSLTFMALLLMVAGVMGSLMPGLASTIAGLSLVLAPVHIFAQLKGTYSLSPWGALWCTFLVSIFCMMVMTFFVIAIIYLGLGH